MQTSEFFLGCRRMAALALRLMLLVCAWLIPASTAFANKWVVVASCPKNQHGQFTQLCMCRGRGDISQPEQAWWSVFDSSTYSDASEFESICRSQRSYSFLNYQEDNVGSVEISPVPPSVAGGQDVAPNIVVTLDNSRSMFRTYSPQSRPFDAGRWDGPWTCAGVIDPRVTDRDDIRSRTMNAVYYNPNVRYVPPIDAKGRPFPGTDSKWRMDAEGFVANRPRGGREPYLQSLGRLRPSANSRGEGPDGERLGRFDWVPLAGAKEKKPIYGKKEELKFGSSCPSGSGAFGTANGCACYSGSHPAIMPDGTVETIHNWEVADEYYSRYGYLPYAQRYENWRRNCSSSTEFRWIENVTRVIGYEDVDSRWKCGDDASSPPPNDGGGPYYYRYKQHAPKIEVDNRGEPTATGLRRLYDRSNWEAVREADMANFANWYVYHRTPTLTMRTVLSRAFGKFGVSADGDGGAIRVAWQNVGAGDPFRLQGDAIISRFADAGSQACNAASVDPVAIGLLKGVVKTPPNCYRSAFFNWLFDDNEFAAEPLSGANARADRFFQRDSGNTSATGDLHDPYWEPPAQSGGEGQRLTCRQNFHLVATDKAAPAGNSLSADGKVRSMYFNPGNPQNLVDRISAALAEIGASGMLPASGGAAGSSTPSISAVNTAVLVPGALGFRAGYSAADWSGTFQAFSLDAHGKSSKLAWDAGAVLDDTGKTNPATRNIFTAKFNNLGRASGVAFKLDSALDWDLRNWFYDFGHKAGASGQDVMNYLRGDRSKEGTAFRKRNHLLGAIIGSQAVYVGRPSGGYRDSWPAGSPEQQAMAGDAADCGRRTPSTCRSYEAFVKNNLGRKPAVYVGANDGMLHAFDASTAKDGMGKPVPVANAGKELFAYLPRSVSYHSLSNLVSKDSSKFMPTVDGVPVTRDVYFSQSTTSPVSTSPGWRTILVGGLRLGGRGVYALDITDPASMDAGKVLWEFHAHMSDFTAWSDGRTVNPGGKPSNLGYTYGQPNIGRLSNGKWVVLVPGGYFPDCAKAPFDGCYTPPEAANTFSSLFVLDAQTGKLIRELKTSDVRNGPTSRGLATPVLGDYDDDQVDDVAFAGDLDGNLWRYDLSASDPRAWTVTLAFKPATAGAQPITSMPRLFADPATGKFMVVFGTGKYLGPGDNADNTIQSVYGIRENGTTVTRSQLVAQTLKETTADDGKTIARGLTNKPVPADKGGWYFDLSLVAGERVVVTPAALFDSGRVVIQTLIPSGDPCASGLSGALMVVNAATGGSAGGISTPSVSAWGKGGETAVVGGRVDNPSTTSGTMPLVTPLGGGSVLVPGLNLRGSGSQLSIDDAIWRRRSWRRIVR